MNNSDNYIEFDRNWRQNIEKIITSKEKFKIIVGGPGTGKTYLFKELLKDKKNSLTLTFVNALVEDISLELCGLTEVRTLHSFAQSILSLNNRSIKLYPKLSEIIKEDAKLILNQEIKFKDLFNTLTVDKEKIDFYKNRRIYYDKYYGFTDIIYGLVKYFEKDEEKIPNYELVLVDEFQDFNKLEMALIDYLYKKSPIVLVGDDDQALYDFKNATPDFIRERFNDAVPNKAGFKLPYCLRSTKVIVETVNDIVKSASKLNMLKNRIPKPYQYFESKEKDLQSANNPYIVYTQKYDAQLARFIENQLEKIAKAEQSKFSVLIICPINDKIEYIARHLESNGFRYLEFKKQGKGNTLELLNGLQILLKNKNSNLGWRIVSKFILSDSKFNTLINNTSENDAKGIAEMLNDDSKKKVNKLLSFLRKIKSNKTINEDDFSFFEEIGIKPLNLSSKIVRKELKSDEQKKCGAAIRNIPIKLTTIQGSKGLAADYVFITHFDDQYLIKKKILDYDICKFIVALTRARKKVYLISSDDRKKPKFLKWIENHRIQMLSSRMT